MAIEFSQRETDDIIPSLQRYIEEELDEEISDFKAKMFLNYIIKEICPYAYNQGVKDAENYFREKVEDLSGSCHEHGLTYWVKQKK